LFELAKLDPSSLEEIEIENKIKKEMHWIVSQVDERNRENERKTNEMVAQMNAFNNMIGFWK
jgi:hypothetical protein